VETFRDSVEIRGKIVRDAQLLQQVILEAETGQRGYIITGETEFLEPYKKANEKFNKVVNDLRKKLKDKPQLLRVLEEIEHLKLKWEGEAGAPEIQLRKLIGESKISLNKINDLILGGTGKNISDKMRVVVQSLEKELRKSNKTKELVLAVEMGRAIVNSETGERGFILTGEESFLEPYYKGQIVFSKKHVLLNELFQGNQTILEKLTQMKILYQDWLTKVAKPEIEARVQFERNPRSIDDLVILLGKGKGQEIIDELRGKTDVLVKALDSAINLELTIAVEMVRSSRTFGLVYVPSCIIISLLLTILLGNSIIKSISSININEGLISPARSTPSCPFRATATL